MGRRTMDLQLQLMIASSSWRVLIAVTVTGQIG
jgi:hypothetical protein